MDVLQITARSFGSSFDRFSVGNLLSGGIEIIARHIYFADTNLTIFSKISFHYSHLRSPPDWQQKDCPKTVFARGKTSGCFSVLVLLLLPHIELCVNPVCLTVPTKPQGFATTL